MQTVTKRKPGRPLVTDENGNKVPLKYDWFKCLPAFQWPNHTDKEISDKVSTTVNGEIYHPSTVAVFLKRQRMIKDGKKVACKKPAFTRAKSVREARALKSAENAEVVPAPKAKKAKK